MSASTEVAVEHTTLRAVTVIAGAMVALTFIFGFGNVWTLAVRLGVPVWIAPLVAPAVDLSIIGLLLATRYLALVGAEPQLLRPARRLLVFSSVVTLVLNVADPLIAGEVGRAALDAVGPLLLIGWAEVGPDLLRALGSTCRRSDSADIANFSRTTATDVERELSGHEEDHESTANRVGESAPPRSGPVVLDDDLMYRARMEDRRHRQECQRPISADTLRRRLGIGSARARHLVTCIRREFDLTVTSAT